LFSCGGAVWLSDSFVSPDLDAPVPASQARQEGLLDLRLRRHRSFVAVASALPLLVTRVGADHHDATVATDHLTLVTDLLDARVDLHVSPFLFVFGWNESSASRPTASTGDHVDCEHGSVARRRSDTLVPIHL
jgi:hypothetical protein